jgi:polyhydroxybutyrate depolymerase
MRAVLPALLVATLLAGCGPTDASAGPCAQVDPGTTREELTVGGVDREYLLHVPEGAADDDPLPVVYMLHGYASNAADLLDSTNAVALADEEAFVLVAPDGGGEPRHWALPSTGSDDDVTFVEELVEHVADDVACVDESRTYVAGFSNGSALAQAVSCQDDSPFAAYVGVSAPFDLGRCPDAAPAPLLYVHGRRDPVITYDGNTRSVIGATAPVELMLDRWRARNGCDERPRVSVRGTIEHRTWTGCDADLEAYVVADGGHQWPGGDRSAAGGPSGKMTRELDGTRTAWTFLSAHRLARG